MNDKREIISILLGISIILIADFVMFLAVWYIAARYIAISLLLFVFGGITYKLYKFLKKVRREKYRKILTRCEVPNGRWD